MMPFANVKCVHSWQPLFFKGDGKTIIFEISEVAVGGRKDWVAIKSWTDALFAFPP